MNRLIKMSRTGILSLIMLAFVSLQPMQAQDKDSRMEENLKMMEKVLNEVFRSGNPNTDQLNVRTSSTDAQYIEGFGILMRTPLFYWNSSNFISLNGRAWSGQNVYIRQNGEVKKSEDAVAPDADADSDKMSQDEIDQSKIDLMTYFLQNYGDLASELPKNEKIMLIYGNKNSRSSSRARVASVTVTGRLSTTTKNERKPGTITVSVSKNDVDRFRSKDLSEDGFKKALSIENLPADDKKRMSYQILGQILQDVVSEYRVSPALNNQENEIVGQYAIGLTGSSRANVNYEILSGYGAVYNLDVKSSILGFHSSRNKGKGSVVIVDGKKIEAGGHDKIVDSVYQALVPAVQKAMIEYGRTLRDLGTDEWLSVKIGIPGCNACEAPSSVEINVPQKVLEAYDTRSISLDTAISRMDVKGKGQAKDKSRSSNYLYFGDDWDHDEDE